MIGSEVVLTNGKPLTQHACDADYRARAIAANRAGERSIEARIGGYILGMRVSLRAPTKKRGRGGATAQRHREERFGGGRLTRTA